MQHVTPFLRRFPWDRTAKLPYGMQHVTPFLRRFPWDRTAKLPYGMQHVTPFLRRFFHEPFWPYLSAYPAFASSP